MRSSRRSTKTYLNEDAHGALEQLTAASVRYRIAVGPQAGRRTLTLRTLSPEAPERSCRAKPFTAGRDGFSLNAGVACEPFQTTTLGRLCRYIARSPLVNERLSTNRTGQVVYELKHPFRDGTTHVALLRASCPPPFGPAFGGDDRFVATQTSVQSTEAARCITPQLPDFGGAMFGLKLEIVSGAESRLARAGNDRYPLLVVGLELIKRLIELNLSIRM